MKQQTQTELSAIVYEWLTNSNNKINKDYCQQEITTHADYPAITAVVDFLDAGNMEYQAVHADASHIQEFNYPLLAHIKKPGNEYMHIILNANAWDAQKETTKHWSGITIFPEKNTIWQNDENKEAIKIRKQQQLFFATWCSIGILFFLVSTFFRPDLWYNIFGFFSLLGVFISAAAFATELGIQSNAVKQVCGAVSKGGCEAVLKSKLAKGIFGITPSDAAVLYFTAQFIVYLSSAFFPNIFNALPYIALMGITIAVVSIYTQSVVIKQWCALCLGIASILLFQVLISIFLVNNFTLYSIVFFAIIAALCIAILLPIKKLLKSTIAAKPKLTELKKMKADVSIFLAKLEKEQRVDITIWENDLIIGNVEAPIMITVVCNPYCGPCARAHMYLDEILERFEGEVKVQMRLLSLPDDDTDKKTVAVKAILQQIRKCKTDKEVRLLLSDWFIQMDFEKWSTTWFNSPNINVNVDMFNHYDWIIKNDIFSTPTFFVNGKKIPSQYGLKDLEKLIPQLSEVFKKL